MWFQSCSKCKTPTFPNFGDKSVPGYQRNHFIIDLIENNGVLTCQDADPLDTTGRVLRAVSESVWPVTAAGLVNQLDDSSGRAIDPFRHRLQMHT
ncbi:hypothetical protein DPMN_044618 [Dreissena polymorpha]|uniref:Uncharacterized protein n=1 Tax=Dreissena polymorpha TaxID=45954 RepID=A0A9D4D3J7_DREPO|nr:hypothetical protein DPMN_044618 [Dreissena polymorpha]